MQQIQLLDKYPTFYLEISRADCILGDLDAIVGYFQQCIRDDALAGELGVFDQCAHTLAVGGDVAPQITAAKNVVFCFGQKLPNAKILAVKPRSIGVADLGDVFAVTFLSAPNDAADQTMTSWVSGLKRA